MLWDVMMYGIVRIKNTIDRNKIGNAQKECLKKVFKTDFTTSLFLILIL